jgi:methyltransferase (TIGR00027 family)
MTESASAGTKRHDGDSWDLASSVGATATAVAARRALASKGPNPLIFDPYAEPLVNAVGVDAFIRMMNGEIDLDEDDPAFTPQRLSEGMAVRTRFFDAFFLEAVGDDAGRASARGGAGQSDHANAVVRQAVILASGLDTRAYRLKWPAATVVYEIDQPQVIEFKTRTLADLGAAPAVDRRAVGIDLRDDWPTALRDSGFDQGRPTAWIAEGLLGYLPPDAQDRLFDNITALSAAGSRVGTGYVPDIRDRVAKNERHGEISERWRRMGLNLNWSELVYDGERNDAATYLSDRGWQTTVRSTPELYAENGFEFPDSPSMAGFGDIKYVSAVLERGATA